jgi:xanthosine utilization system XapX-like protein
MNGIGSLFGSLVAIVGVVGVLVMVVAPTWGREILKNLGVSLALFILGCVLLEAACPGHAQPADSHEEEMRYAGVD